MAKRGQFAGDPAGARQYLANLIASDQWQASKPLDQYQDSQMIRKANAFRQQELAGLPFDNKAARGHADIVPSRPEVVQPPAGRPGPQVQRDQPARPVPPMPLAAPWPAPRVRKDLKIFHAPKLPMDTRINGPRGSYQINSTRFKDVIHELKNIQKSRGVDAKVYFSLWDNRKGDWTKMYVWKGAKPATNGVRVGDV